MLVTASLCVLLLLLTHGLDAINVKVGVLLTASPDHPFDDNGPMVSAAVKEGINDAMSKYGVTFEAIYRNVSGNCERESNAAEHMAEMVYNHSVKAVIGPACSRFMVNAARMAEYLKIPLVTGLGDLMIKDPTGDDMFKTLTVMPFSVAKIAKSMISMLTHLGWRHTTVMYSLSYDVFQVAGEHLVKELRTAHGSEHTLGISFHEDFHADDHITDLLEDAQSHSRVIMLFCSVGYFRYVLYRGYILGMSSDSFAFITLDVFKGLDGADHRQFTRKDEYDKGVATMYQSVLIVAIPTYNDQDFNTFSAKAIRRAKTENNFTYPDHSVGYFTTAFYESVIYLAYAFKKASDDGVDTSDGLAIAQILWNKTFPSITGTVAIDENGDRIADYYLYDMQSINPRVFKVVGVYLGSEKEYKPVPGRHIVWPFEKPDDVPVEFNIMRFGSLLVACVLYLAGMVAVCIMCRVSLFFKKRNNTDRMSWLVKPTDMTMRQGTFSDAFISKSWLVLESGKMAVSELIKADCKSAVCRGDDVSVRLLEVDHMEITDNLRRECRRMDALSHRNIAKFVALCQDEGDNSIMYEFCKRGCLTDMIHNPCLKLEWKLRYSFIDDIIKGMMYLHESSVHCHGHLTSMNCLIDIGFKVKISDYGPKTLLQPERLVDFQRGCDADELLQWKKLLWVAPEHLRTVLHYSSYGSQKGDVYSFSIILQELIMLTEPFSTYSTTAKDLIGQLKSVEPFLIRPEIPEGKCPSDILLSITRACWLEDPDARPTFQDIDRWYTPIAKQYLNFQHSDVKDRLLGRMQVYTEKLEKLAVERTKLFQEQMLKFDALLHKILPVDIAKLLQTGNTVPPETYSSVSILFSDIVNFQLICGRSSPGEVVNILNELYTVIEVAVAQFEVFKVDTVGDSFMCVSGLPVRIGDRHAQQICNFALVLQQALKGVVVRHLQREKVTIRMGIHTGPCVACVVGATMPRFCIFGDTVKTAYRLQKLSEPLKIIISKPTYQLLSQFPGYQVVKRGEEEIKGLYKDRGPLETFWLNECDLTDELYPGMPRPDSSAN